MKPNETMVDDTLVQVALFPLEGFSISQPWWGTFSHEGGATYYATDFLCLDENGNRVLRALCYAPVDIELLWLNQTNCVALWQSLVPVRFADGSLDYLGIIVYHDNDIENGTYYQIGTIKRQGEIFNRSGTGGNVTGDHVHLETGKGRVNLSQYKYHFRDDTDCKRIVPDNVLFVNDTFVTPYTGYNWKIYQPSPEPFEIKKTKFPWVLYSRKLRNKRNY